MPALQSRYTAKFNFEYTIGADLDVVCHLEQYDDDTDTWGNVNLDNYTALYGGVKLDPSSDTEDLSLIVTVATENYNGSTTYVPGDGRVRLYADYTSAETLQDTAQAAWPNALTAVVDLFGDDDNGNRDFFGRGRIKIWPRTAETST